MKLHDSHRAPNPRRLRTFHAQKSVEIERNEVDIGKHQHRSAADSPMNPLQPMPALVRNDGAVPTESIAICFYGEELDPDPPLFAGSPSAHAQVEHAQVEMGQRRLEWRRLLSAALAFRHGHPATVEFERQKISLLAEENRPKANFLETEPAQSEVIAGSELSVADITGLVAIDFMRPARIPFPPDLVHVRSCHAGLCARANAAVSIAQ